METLDAVIFLSLSGFAFLGLCAYQSFRTSIIRPTRKLKRRVDVDQTHRANSAAATEYFDRWFTNLITKSGLKSDVTTAAVFLGCIAVLAGAIGFVLDWNPIFQLLFSITVFAIGVAAIFAMQNYRIRQFTTKFPAALDLVARSTRTGSSLETALSVAQRKSEQPIRDEFNLCLQQLRLGHSATDVTRDLARRIGNMDTQIFAHTISVHQNLGGRLADALEHLAEVIRERANYVEKARAATDIGRFAVVAIVFMAVFVFLFLMFAYPEYLGKLYVSPLGQKMITYAALSELVGLVWVFLTLKSEY